MRTVLPLFRKSLEGLEEKERGTTDRTKSCPLLVPTHHSSTILSPALNLNNALFRRLFQTFAARREEI
jgi:hypothetical protein